MLCRPVYIWNHPKSASTLTPEYISTALQGHLHVGVHPTVPVKNNDHAIGGDCAPGCPYDGTFVEYGALFVAIRNRRWLLDAHVAAVMTVLPGSQGTPAALVNCFSTPSDNYASPTAAEKNVTVLPSAITTVVTFAPQFGQITVQIRASTAFPTLQPSNLVARFVQPGDTIDDEGRSLPASHSASSCATSPSGGSVRGCATLRSATVSDGVVTAVLQFGGTVDITGAQNNVVALVLQQAS